MSYYSMLKRCAVVDQSVASHAVYEAVWGFWPRNGGADVEQRRWAGRRQEIVAGYVRLRLGGKAEIDADEVISLIDAGLPTFVEYCNVHDAETAQELQVLLKVRGNR